MDKPKDVDTAKELADAMERDYIAELQAKRRAAQIAESGVIGWTVDIPEDKRPDMAGCKVKPE